jgi:hypothetical protein
MSEAPQPPPSGQPPGASGGSRTLWIYLAVGTGVVVLAIILFVVLRPDDSETAADTTSLPQATTVQTTTEVTTQQTTTVATTTVQTTTTPADQPVRVTVRYENGEVVGGIVRADIEEGSEVVLVVFADVEDEVHVHGYDLMADVTPNQRARITFRADMVGEFEVELEDLGVPIAELTVS